MAKKLMKFEDGEEYIDSSVENTNQDYSSGYDLNDDGMIPKLEELKAMGRDGEDISLEIDDFEPIGMNPKKIPVDEFLMDRANIQRTKTNIKSIKIIDEKFDDDDIYDDEPDFLAVDYDFDYDELQNDKKNSLDEDDLDEGSINIDYYDEYDKKDDMIKQLKRIADALEKISEKL